MEVYKGQRFGMLTATGQEDQFYTEAGWTYRRMEVVCDCGNTKFLRKRKVLNGKLISCGCTYITENGEMRERHGASNTRLFFCWQSMKSRCTNPNDTGYYGYGGRGITFCDSWKDFVNFRDDMAEGYQEGLTLDRIDPNGNYCKENCRWATASTQSYNQRKSVHNKSGKTGVLWDKKSSKWRVKFTPPGQKQINKWYVYQWDAVYERMLLEQTYHGKVKE